MSENLKKNTLNIVDLLSVVFDHIKLIIGMTVGSAVLIVVLSVISIKLPPEKSFLPNKYTPAAVMVISDNSSSSNLVSALSSSSLGTIASMSGMSLGASNSALAMYLVTSNRTLDSIAKEFSIAEKYEITEAPIANCRKLLKTHLAATYNEDSGIFVIKYTDIDPIFASDVVNYTVNYLDGLFNEIGLDENKRTKKNLEDNIAKTYEQLLDYQKQLDKISKSANYYNISNNGNTVVQDVDFLSAEILVQQEIYKELKTQYEMLKVNMESQRPIFQVLEYAQVPDLKSGPSRGKLCVVVVMGAFFVSLFLAFLIDAIKKLKNDPEEMSKLKGLKK